jgi:hypothetical protein
VHGVWAHCGRECGYRRSLDLTIINNFGDSHHNLEIFNFEVVVNVTEIFQGGQEPMKSRIFLVGAVILMAFIVSAWAADVAGKWIAEAPSGQQGTSEITLVFKVDGTALTGTLDNSAMPGAIEIKDGKVEGDDVSFHVLRSFGENEMKVVWKGKAAGDEIKFTRAIEGGMMGGGPGGGAGGGGAAPDEIIAKRAD